MDDLIKKQQRKGSAGPNTENKSTTVAAGVASTQNPFRCMKIDFES